VLVEKNTFRIDDDKRAATFSVLTESMPSSFHLSDVLAKLRTSLRQLLGELRRLYLVHVWGMRIGRGSAVSFSAKLDKTNPRGIHVGQYTAICFDSVILTHDTRTRRHVDTWIGDNCLIGGKAIIYPGVRIGNNCVVGLGSVVMGNVPDGSIVSGYPARVIRSGNETGPGACTTDLGDSTSAV